MTVEAPVYRDLRWDPATNAWSEVKRLIGTQRLTLGPSASQQWMEKPEHLLMVMARYRAAAALIGSARTVVELGCGEAIGAGLLAKGRQRYCGVDNDADAIRVARAMYAGHDVISFSELSAVDDVWLPGTAYDAVVSLDTLEHIPAERERDFMANAVAVLGEHGVMVIGTPNARFLDLASPQSQAGHVNNFDHDRLYALMGRYFHVVIMAGMQDTAMHFGHRDARHYHLVVGFAPKRDA